MHNWALDYIKYLLHQTLFLLTCYICSVKNVFSFWGIKKKRRDLKLRVAEHPWSPAEVHNIWCMSGNTFDFHYFAAAFVFHNMFLNKTCWKQKTISICVETVVVSGFGKTKHRLTSYHPANLCILGDLQACSWGSSLAVWSPLAESTQHSVLSIDCTPSITYTVSHCKMTYLVFNWWINVSWGGQFRFFSVSANSTSRLGFNH